MLLGELPELEFELVRRVNPLLDKERIHGVDGRAEPIIAGQAFHSVFKADEFFVF